MYIKFLSDDKMKTTFELYEMAVHKVDHSPKLRPYADFILADWTEGDEHLRWIIYSSIKEILNWIPQEILDSILE